MPVVPIDGFVSGVAGALYETDFGEYGIGATLSDWTADHNGTPPTLFEVKAVVGTESGQVLAWRAASGASLSMTWDDVPSTEDVEILAYVRTTASIVSGIGMGAVGRVTTPETAISCYIGRQNRFGTSTWTNRIVDFVSGTGATAVNNTGDSFSQNTWYANRLLISGADIKHKRWPVGSAEPGSWDCEYTDATDVHPAGLCGLWFNATTTSQEFQCQYFAVGTNGVSPAVP